LKRPSYFISHQFPKMTDKLFFNSRSADAYPGAGVNEIVVDTEAYKELSKTRHWRRILSNFHVCEFKWRGYTYRTIEHAFQAAKIGLVSEADAYRFTVESGTELGRGDGLDARKARKVVDLGARIKEWDAISRQVMEEIAQAKYAVCEEARTVLRATGKAELWHLVMRSKIHERFVHLERIRSEL